MAESARSTSGYTEAEAMEFQKGYFNVHMLFVAVAAVAHYLVWQWKPWL
jgi:light-harvesting complex 1 beta chain